MDDDYLEQVLDLVAAVPAGRAVTYGSVAEVLRDRLGRGGPRQVSPKSPRQAADMVGWRWPRTDPLVGTLGPDLRSHPGAEAVRTPAGP